MKKITNDLKLIHPKATVPKRGSDCAAGYDITCVGGLDGLDPKLVAKLEEKDPDSLAGMRQLAGRALILFPGASYLFRTGITMAIEPGYQCLLWDRSGLGGIDCVHRLAGVIDEDYRGEWLVRLINFGRNAVMINEGDRIIQGVFQERVEAIFEMADELPSSNRSTGGFGASGK